MAVFVTNAPKSQDRLAESVDWFAQRTGRQVPDSVWEDIPFTRKQDLRTFDYQGDPGRVLCWLSSSGTSADPVLFPWSEEDQHHADQGARAAQQGHDDLTGRSAVIVAPTGVSGVGHFARRQVLALGGTAIHLGIAGVDAILHAAERCGATILITLPRVASRLGATPEVAAGHPLRHLIVAGDVMTPARLRHLSQTWQATTLDYFGMSEVYGPVASQLSVGTLRWTAPDVGVEVLDPETCQPVGPGQVGVLVITTLWRKAMPLLRYWTDDHVRLLPSPAGELRFTSMGRPLNHVVLAPARRVYLRDVDEIVLAAPWATPEWRLECDGRACRLLVESLGASGAELDAMREAVSALGPWSVEVATTPFGSLPRDEPKLVMHP